MQSSARASCTGHQHGCAGDDMHGQVGLTQALNVASVTDDQVHDAAGVTGVVLHSQLVFRLQQHQDAHQIGCPDQCRCCC